MTETGYVDIHGKPYKTVALRVDEFREEFPDYTIKTKIVSVDEERVVMKATILDVDGRVLSTGHAEERRVGNINLTSALENCETSSVGRALSFFKYAGTEIRSADEMVDAIQEQKNVEMIEYNKLVKEHIFSISAIKHFIRENDYSSAIEAFMEIPDDDKKALWKADTKGGIFTTQEVKVMRSDEWTAERNSMYQQAIKD